MKPEQLQKFLDNPAILNLPYKTGVTFSPDGSGEGAISVTLAPSEKGKTNDIPSSIPLVNELGESEQVPVVIKFFDPPRPAKV